MNNKSQCCIPEKTSSPKLIYDIGSSRHLNSWVVSHSALIIGTLRHALDHEFEPRWQLTLFWTQAQHLRFIHDSIWFVWFDTIICMSNLSWELWNRKLKIKEIYFKKTSKRPYHFDHLLRSISMTNGQKLTHATFLFYWNGRAFCCFAVVRRNHWWWVALTKM